MTGETADLIRKEAEDKARNQSQQGETAPVAPQKHQWTPVKHIDRRSVSGDTREYTLAMPEGKRELGLGTGQHIQLDFHMKDKMLVRSYTLTCPNLPITPQYSCEQ